MWLVLLLFVAGRCLVPMDETDLFFNLRLGELWLATGRVPTENTLSFTHPHAPEVNLAWLFQGLLVWAYRIAGMPGTVLLKTGFVVVTFALLYRVARQWGAHPVWAGLGLALAAWSAEPRFVERPHLVTFLGLALLLLALARAEIGRPRLLWALVPLALPWANANSCFFLAPGVLLLYAAGALGDGLRTEAKRSALLALVLAPFIVATPSGFRAFSYIANHFRMPYLRPLEEYRHAAWPVDGPFFFLVIGTFLVFGIAWLRRKTSTPDPGWQPPLRYFLPVLALGILGALRIRFVAEFSLLAGPLLAMGLSRQWRLPKWSHWPLAAALLLLMLLPRAEAAREGRKVLDLGMEPDLVPHEAIAFVTQKGLRDRMYCDMEVGSYLTFEGWPRYPVFQDPRINSYPEEFHRVLRRSDLRPQEWQAFLDAFGVRSALLTYPNVNPRGAYFDPTLWALVYRAKDGLVFVRRPLPVGMEEVPITFSYHRETGLLPVPIEHRPAESTLSACAWDLAVGDYQQSAGREKEALSAYERALASTENPMEDSACRMRVRLALGAVALRLGQAARAAEVLQGIEDVSGRTNHGFALLALGYVEQALADFDAVLGKSPGSDEATFGRGTALSALGRREEAIFMFKRLLDRSPRHFSAPAAQAALLRLTAGAP